MIQKIERVSDRYAITISRTALDMLGVPEGADVEVRVSPGRITIQPVDPGGHAARVRESASEMVEIHREAFEKLAE
jgi:antitoxin component of MazEF toxin-antitoxin module